MQLMKWADICFLHFEVAMYRGVPRGDAPDARASPPSLCIPPPSGRELQCNATLKNNGGGGGRSA